MEQFISAVWLAKFNDSTELSDYVEWIYPEDEDEQEDPTCMFANDIGINWFDHDFIESGYYGTSSEVLKNIEGHSFVEYYLPDLQQKLNSIDYSDKNSIIILSGIRDDINSFLFNFTPINIGKEHLQFVGLFQYLVSKDEKFM
jgi:immunity protein 22 of polymorphic toxin system